MVPENEDGPGHGSLDGPESTTAEIAGVLAQVSAAVAAAAPVTVGVGMLLAGVGTVLHLLGWGPLVLWIGVGIVGLGLLLLLLSFCTYCVWGILADRALRHATFTQRWVGVGIPWEEVKAQILRVLKFVPHATVEGETVVSKSRDQPYGSLTVRDARFPQPLLVPVAHRLDFLALWRCYEEQAVSDGEYLYVVYQPARRMHRFLPSLVLLISDMPEFHEDEWCRRWAQGTPPYRVYWNAQEVHGWFG